MTDFAEDSDPHTAWPAGADRLVSAAPWSRIVAIGDSVAAGVREPLDGYIDRDGIGRVADAFGGSVEYRNLGVPQLRVAEVRASQLKAALDFEPDLAILAAGGNDVLAKDFDEHHVESELTAIVKSLRGAGADVVTIGLFDLARSGLVPAKYALDLADRFDRLDALTRRVVEACGGAHTDNHMHPLATDPGIFSTDKIHCNARGHAVAAATLVQSLLALWAAPRSGNSLLMGGHGARGGDTSPNPLRPDARS